MRPSDHPPVVSIQDRLAGYRESTSLCLLNGISTSTMRHAEQDGNRSITSLEYHFSGDRLLGSISCITTHDVPRKIAQCGAHENYFPLRYFLSDHHVCAGSAASWQQLARSYAGLCWSSIASISRPTASRRSISRIGLLSLYPGYPCNLSNPRVQQTDTVYDMSSITAETSRRLLTIHLKST